jgi:hypothetical protein
MTVHRLSLHGMGVQLPEVTDHPNAWPWSGVLTILDEPSTRPPHGSDGHLVLMPEAVAEAALPTLIGMAVNFCWEMDSHVPTQKVGIITQAEVVTDNGKRAIAVSGILYAADFPWEVEQIKRFRDALGMSFELQRVLVESRTAPVWRLLECVFTGAAILLKDKAAYQHTSLAASAADMKETPMEELIKALLAATELNTAAQAANGELLAKIAASSEQTQAAVEAAAKGEKADDEEADDDMAASKLAAAVAEAIAPLQQQVTDLAAKAAAQPAPNLEAAGTGEPERKTLSPLVTTLLAKHGGDDATEMNVERFDGILAAAGITDTAQRIAAKNEARRSGAIK